jgi:hypothetical protein
MSAFFSVLCRERTFWEFRADSHFRNYPSKKKSIASESPFSKKKAEPFLTLPIVFDN